MRRPEPHRHPHALSAAVAIGALVALAGCAARPSTLVERPPVEDPDRVGLGFFSHADPGARRDYFHADDFTLDAPAVVEGVRWTGLVDRTGAVDLRNVAGFAVEVRPALEDGAPGEPVRRVEVPLEETNPRATGRIGSAVGPASDAAEFRHAVAFDPPLELGAGRWWLVVAARLADPAAENWQWQDGETDDGVSWSWSYARDAWQRVEDTDSAFQVLGRYEQNADKEGPSKE